MIQRKSFYHRAWSGIKTSRFLVPFLAIFGLLVPVRAEISFQVFETSSSVNAYATGELVQGTNGEFFGVMEGGGDYKQGSVFKWATNGTLTTLFSFAGTNGRSPVAGLVFGADGWLYGTTASGGDFNAGTVYKISPDGQFTNLVMFTGTSGNGSNPRCRLIQARDGNFYGTTYSGPGGASIFKVTPDGQLTFLAFLTDSIGNMVYAGLVEGDDGNFYGTAYGGGWQGMGTVFQVTPSGTVSPLVLFTESNGANPQAALTRGNDGCLYGTTATGGTYGYGTVFKVTLSGTLTTLASFAGTNGNWPQGVLVPASDGNLYGTTYQGGTGGFGTLFRISPGGNLTTIVEFGAVLSYPIITSGLIEASDGSLYGLESRHSSIYRLTGVNSSPAVSDQPASRILLRGAAANLKATVNTTGPTAYQWFFNGAALPAATNLSCSASLAGDYQLLASNRFGMATSSVAKVTFWDFTLDSRCQAWFDIEGRTGNNYRLETTTNMVAWNPLTNFSLASDSLLLTDPASTNLLHCFYRLVLLP